MLEKYFHLRENGTNVKTELIAGQTVTVKDGKLRCEGRPIIFTLPNPITKKY